MNARNAAVLGVALAILLPAGLALTRAAEPTKTPAPAADVQEVDTFEAVQPPTQPVTFMTLVGRMHPALVHFPIGWLSALALIDVLTFLARRTELNTAGHLLLGASVAALVAAATTGFLRAAQLPSDPCTLHAIALHRNVMLAVFGLALGAAGLRWARSTPLSGVRRVAYLGCVFLAAFLVLLGGHLGGRLVFGDTYLPF